MLNQKSFTTLRRFVRERAVKERCELCGKELAESHQHLLEPLSRQLVCACDECVVSMGNRAGTPYRRVPQRIRSLPNFQLTDAQWDSLLIPVGMAFFFYNTPAKRMMVLYPSPAGATESLLTLETWEEIVRGNPLLTELKPDVEALLVNRLRANREYYLVPIDRCYELVGLIKANWRGLSGGSEVWDEIKAFYARLKAEAGHPGEETHA